jgi:nucleotide-binding universal stress UspA family protein
MRVLVPVDASQAALAPIAHLAGLQRSGVPLELVILNVQPRFSRHIAQFTNRTAREALRTERSSAAMARAIEAASRAGIRFRALAETGLPAERIAAVAAREEVSEIMLGVGRHPVWLRSLNPSIAQSVMARTDIPVTVFARGQPGVIERYVVPAGVAGLVGLLLAVE